MHPSRSLNKEEVEFLGDGNDKHTDLSIHAFKKLAHPPPGKRSEEYR